MLIEAYPKEMIKDEILCEQLWLGYSPSGMDTPDFTFGTFNYKYVTGTRSVQP